MVGMESEFWGRALHWSPCRARGVRLTPACLPQHSRAAPAHAAVSLRPKLWARGCVSPWCCSVLQTPRDPSADRRARALVGRLGVHWEPAGKGLGKRSFAWSPRQQSLFAGHRPRSGHTSPSPSPVGVRQVRLAHRPEVSPLWVSRRQMWVLPWSLSPASIRGWGSLARTPVCILSFLSYGVSCRAGLKTGLWSTTYAEAHG